MSSRVVFFFACASVLWLLWIMYIRNGELTKALEQMNMALKAEVERSVRVEQATQRLENKDGERQVQLKRFERKLGALATENAALRDVLSVVVPPELVDGLRAFRPHGSR